MPNKTRGTQRNVTNVTRTSRFPRVGDVPRRETAGFEPPRVAAAQATRAPGSDWQIDDQDGLAIDRSAMVLPPRFDGAGSDRSHARHVICCTSVYSSMLQRPPSRPMPLSLKPPNGPSNMLMPLLIHTTPVRMRFAISTARVVSRA